MRSWNNLRQVCSKSNDWEAKLVRSKKTKGPNRLDKIVRGRRTFDLRIIILFRNTKFQ